MVTSFLRRHNISFLSSKKKMLWTDLRKLGLMFLMPFPSRLKYQQVQVHRERFLVHRVCMIHTAELPRLMHDVSVGRGGEHAPGWGSPHGCPAWGRLEKEGSREEDQGRDAGPPSTPGLHGTASGSSFRGACLASIRTTPRGSFRPSPKQQLLSLKT